ncbi:MAG: hypothetical protein V1492_06180 [Candidatus Micrarchaeota archaeon]
MRRLLVFGILLAVFLLAGCYGADAQNAEQCDSMLNVERQMECYHQAAVFSAYMRGDDAHSTFYCYQIQKMGEYYGQRTGNWDVQQKSLVLKNRCFYDIATILATTNPTGVNSAKICENIGKGDPTVTAFTSTLTGTPVTKQVCIDQVNRTMKISPQNYYDTKDPKNTNICTLTTGVAGLVLLFLFTRGVHKL